MAAVLAAALLMSGCWLQPGFDARSSRANTLESTLTLANVDTLSQAWSAPIVATSTPLVAKARVLVGGFTADDTPVVEAFALSGGTALWSGDGEPAYPDVGWSVDPTIIGEDVWIGSFPDPNPPALATNFTAFDVDDGTTTGAFQASGAASYPVAAGNIVVQTTQLEPTETSAGMLIARDRQTMDVLWTADLAGPVHEPPGAPVVAGDVIYAAYGPAIHAFDLAGCGAPTCTPTWTVTLASQQFADRWAVEVMAATETGAALVRDHADYGDRTLGQLVAISADGTVQWSHDMEALYSVATIDDTVYVSGRVGSGSIVRAVQDGTTIWQTPVSESYSASSIAIAGGVVYRGSGSSVEAYDADGCGEPTCVPIITAPVQGNVRDVSVAGGHLLVASEGNHLTAFAPATSP